MRFLTTIALVLLGAAALGVAFLYRADLPTEFVDQKYSNDASEFLALENGARLHYRDQGEGKAVVLIHGSNSSLHTWEPWIGILKSQYRIVTLDLPGHGLTGQVPDREYGFEAQIETVDALVEHLGLETFVLGGNSMGGGTTWRYALAHPEKVDAMILVCAAGPWAWREQVQRPNDVGEAPIVFQLLAQPWFRAIARYLDPRLLVEQGVRSAYNDSAVVTDELIERYYELALREGSRAATMARFATRTPPDHEADLGSLTQPTLVLWGAQDALIPVETASRFEEALPNATVRIHDDLGHSPMEEAPRRTAANVLTFLEQLNEDGDES